MHATTSISHMWLHWSHQSSHVICHNVQDINFIGQVNLHLSQLFIKQAISWRDFALFSWCTWFPSALVSSSSTPSECEHSARPQTCPCSPSCCSCLGEYLWTSPARNDSHIRSFNVDNIRIYQASILTTATMAIVVVALRVGRNAPLVGCSQGQSGRVLSIL